VARIASLYVVFPCKFARTVSHFDFLMDLFSFSLFSFLFVFQLAGGLDAIIVGLGYDPIMMKREISTGEREQLLSLSQVRDADLTKVMASNSRRLARARFYGNGSFDGRLAQFHGCRVPLQPCTPVHRVWHLAARGVMASFRRHI
jgi:hypothetical protein